jgi:hypothetical protein
VSTGQRCDACDGENSRAARWCQWCGASLRGLEDFETPRGDTDGCPCCGSAPAEVSWQTAPHQSVCSTDGCPVNTWDETTSKVPETADEYIDIREIHPACVKLPCRYETCDNEKWVCGSGSANDFTVCSACYDGPDISHLLENVTVRL